MFHIDDYRNPLNTSKCFEIYLANSLIRSVLEDRPTDTSDAEQKHDRQVAALYSASKVASSDIERCAAIGLAWHLQTAEKLLVWVRPTV